MNKETLGYVEKLVADSRQQVLTSQLKTDDEEDCDEFMADYHEQVGKE